MNDSRVRQFKLTSGDEIICEVLEWDDTENSEIIVRHLFEIRKVDMMASSTRLYTIQPYVSFQVGDTVVSSINSDHISVISQPAKTLIDQYKSSIKNYVLEESDSADLEEKFENIKKFLDQLEEDYDSDVSNIIHFPRGTVH